MSPQSQDGGPSPGDQSPSNLAISDEEIDQQIALRNRARDEKDFQTADKIRDSLIEQGIILDDSSEGTTWKKS